MRVALYLDNRGLAGRGALPRPSRGNPGVGGTEFEFLALAEQLVVHRAVGVELLLLLTAPQAIEGLPADRVAVVTGLAEALERAESLGVDVLVFRPGFAGPSDWAALEATRIPLVAWLHNLGCAEAHRYDALSALRRWVLVSGPQADFFRHSRLFQRAVVIPNFVFTPPTPARDLKQVQASRDLGYVGALTPFKGFHVLARHWGAIARRHPEARLRVFGGANLYQGGEKRPLSAYELHCHALLERGGHGDRVVFEGSLALERYDHLGELRAVVVNPSGRDETFCLSAAECGACGLAVVAGRRHALVDTVEDGRTGLLVRGGQELVRASSILLSDPQLAWALGSEAKDSVARRFDPETTVRSWLALFAELRAGAPAEAPTPQTPWHHEQRWLRQLWGALLVLPFWPDWPTLKAGVKRRLQGRQPIAIGPQGVGLLAGLVALLIWALVVVGKYGGNPTGLARIGDQMALSPRLDRSDLVILKGKRGNDGQQFLTLALDPSLQDPGTSAAVDNPIYRGKRVLYPLLAWLLGLGQPALIVWSLGLINVACVGTAAALVAQWAQLEQRSPLWGLSVLALPGYWITLSLGTADLLATTLLLAAAVALRLGRPRTLAASLAAALLARETALLAWAATGLASLRQRRWAWLLPLALVPLPLLLWTASLRARFAATADGLLASLHFTWPGFGVAEKLAQLLGLVPIPDGHVMGLGERLFDGLCLALWLATLAVLTLTALGRLGSGLWLRMCAGVYLLTALCTSTQILARFPDYTRVWIDLASLALLALIGARGRLLGLWLGTSALTSLGYWLGYLVLAL